MTYPLVLALGLACSSTASETGDSAQGGTAGAPGASGSAGTNTTSHAAGMGGASAGGAGVGVGGVGGSASGAGGAGAAGGAGGRGGHGGSAGSGGSGGGNGEVQSAGCGKMRTLQDGKRTVQSGGTERSYVLRVPADYDNRRAHRLVLGFHGANESSSNVAPGYFGLWDLSQGSTIFAAPDAVGGLWKADTDTKMVEDLLAQLKGDLCIDTSRIVVEGFSQGGAMSWTLACALPGTFRAAIVHSGGGLPLPKACEPIAFWSALGDDGSGQDMSSDLFAKTNGCTVESLPLPPNGGHACSDYQGCSAGHPTRWCAYDGGHTPAHTDSGQSKSWVPQEVWNFVKQL